MGTRDGRADGFDLETLRKLDSVKDSQGRDLRHFVFGIFLSKFKEEAILMLKDLGPVLRYVTRRVDQRNDSVEIRKQVSGLESYRDDVKRFEDEFKEKNEILRKILSFIEDDTDPFTMRMSEEFRKAGNAIDELSQLSERAFGVYSDVLAWFGEKASSVLSADFILIWDNLLVPPELIERKPWLPDVKYKLGPKFCKPREIVAEDLEDLWETQKMGMAPEAPTNTVVRRRPLRSRTQLLQEGTALPPTAAQRRGTVPSLSRSAAAITEQITASCSTAAE